MWEQIRSNKIKSVLLIMIMAAVLGILGAVIGSAVSPDPQAGLIGIAVALGIWLIMAMVSFSSGDAILLSASNAVAVTRDVHPQLFNVVEEMAIAASLPMPKIYIINDPAPNAFATGRNPQSASLAVTAGLLGRLSRDELQGVVGHEMSHILNRDILFVTIAGIMLGAITLISQVFMRGMFYSSMGGRRYSSRDKGGGAQAIMLIIAIVVAILAPIMAALLYFALSRRREYLADAGSARLTRYPEGLASALEKISQNTVPLAVANKVTAPMYIVNPLQQEGEKLYDLTSTHPPISERIKILRSMAGASYADYAESFNKITKQSSPIPASAIKDETVKLRPASQQPAVSAKDQYRNVGDIMQKTLGYSFVTCTCGLKLKIPPNYHSSQVECPRCGNVLSV